MQQEGDQEEERLQLLIEGTKTDIALLKKIIKKWMPKEMKKIYSIKRNWASFFLKHFQKSLNPEWELDAKILEQLKKMNQKKQKKFTQANFLSMLELEKKEKEWGGFRNRFKEWLTNTDFSIIIITQIKIAEHRPIYEQLRIQVLEELSKEDPFKKFMSTKQSGSFQTFEWPIKILNEWQVNTKNYIEQTENFLQNFD